MLVATGMEQAVIASYTSNVRSIPFLQDCHSERRAEPVLAGEVRAERRILIALAPAYTVSGRMESVQFAEARSQDRNPRSVFGLNNRMGSNDAI